MVLESVNGNQERAIETLLGMSDPDYKPETPTAAQAPSTPRVRRSHGIIGSATILTSVCHDLDTGRAGRTACKAIDDRGAGAGAGALVRPTAAASPATKAEFETCRRPEPVSPSKRPGKRHNGRDSTISDQGC